MLTEREIEALDQAGLTPELREEVIVQAQGQLWVRIYRLGSSYLLLIVMVALAMLVSLTTRSVLPTSLLMAGMIAVPLLLVMLLAATLSWSSDPAVQFRNRLIRLSINATKLWGGDKARLDLAELAEYAEGAESAAVAVVVLAPYRQKRRLYHTTFAMGLSLFVVTIVFFTIGLPLMLGLG